MERTSKANLSRPNSNGRNASVKTISQEVNHPSCTHTIPLAMHTVQPEFAEIQTTILNWTRAIDDFHRYYGQLNKAINGLQHQGLAMTSSAVDTHTKIRTLKKLRQCMGEILATLLTDLNGSKSTHHRASDALDTQGPGQLTKHTQLLKEINQKVVREMKYCQVLQD